MNIRKFFTEWFDRWRDSLPARLLTLPVAVLVLATLHVDPFGVHSASADQSAETHARITAPFYASEGQSRVTVILIDDALLDRLGSSWPMTYSDQGTLLRKILGYKPAAVFVDLLHERPHASASSDQPKDLVDALGSAGELVAGGATPVLIATIPAELSSATPQPVCGDHAISASGGAPRLLEEFTNAGFKGSFSGWTGCGSKYPLFLYGDPAHATPAFALYRDVYCRENTGAACEHARNAPAAARDFKDPLLVVWGAIPSEAHARLSSAGGVPCQDARPSRGDRLRLSFSQSIQSIKDTFTWSTERGERLVCPFTDVVSANWLYGSHGDEVRPFIEGRIVMLGTHVLGVGDLVRNPVNGQVPGVMVHAMALDNLIRYGDGYVRSFSKLVFITLEFLLLVIFVMVLSASPPQEDSGRHPAHAAHGKGGLALPIASALLWLLVIGYLFSQHSWWNFLFAWLLFIGWDLYKPKATATLALQCAAGIGFGLLVGWCTNYGPINWGGVIVALLGLAALEHGVEKPKFSEQSLLLSWRRKE